jgi:predicted anti-sigma-YlaC factor YlaD
MTCPWGLRVIDGDLSEVSDLSLVEHLQACESCKDELTWILTFRSLLIPSMNLPRSFIERTLDGLTGPGPDPAAPSNDGSE